MNAIDSADVLKVLTPIWTTKPETARRLKQRMKVVFDWAKASGFRSGDNPTDGLTKVLPKHRGDKQHHAALPYQAVPAFVTTLAHVPDTSDADPPRLGVADPDRDAHERSAARDVGGNRSRCSKVWTIPGARMKSGSEHRVPLSPRAVEILEAARRLTDGQPSDWIFPGTKPGKPLSNMTFLKARAPADSTRPPSRRTASGVRSATGARRRPTSRGPSAKRRSRTCRRDKTEAAYHRTDLSTGAGVDGRRGRVRDRTPADVVSIGA